MLVDDDQNHEIGKKYDDDEDAEELLNNPEGKLLDTPTGAASEEEGRGGPCSKRLRIT